MAPATTRVLAALSFALGLASAAQRFAAVPLMTDVADDLLPRYVVDKSFPIAKRVAGCDEGNHSCEETGFGDNCCADDTYCYVNRDGDPRCCPIGSNCINDSACRSDAFYCTQNSTVTITEDGTETETVTEEAGCCPRRCAETSFYLCSPDRGGGCCGYGTECNEDGNCVNEIQPSNSAALTPIVEGCTTSQYRCEDGNGCCDDNQICTEVSNTGYCAPGIPTQSNVTLIDEDDLDDSDGGGGGGLSDGAKAGIAVGVVVAAGAVIGAATWLCISKRKRRRQRNVPYQVGGPDGSYGQPVGQEDAATATGMTDISGAGRPQPGRGLTQEYHGPDAVAGPFTESPDIQYHPSVGNSPASFARAVPTSPQDAHDIVPPVEIGSNPNAEPMSPMSYRSPVAETIDGRFELHGTDTMISQPRTSLQIQSPLTPESDEPRRFGP